MSALLLDNAYLLILAVGMTFVILTGGIDLSVGSVHGVHRDPAAPSCSATGCPPCVVVPVTILVRAP